VLLSPQKPARQRGVKSGAVNLSKSAKPSITKQLDNTIHKCNPLDLACAAVKNWSEVTECVALTVICY
jgi:hypothetical protein